MRQKNVGRDLGWVGPNEVRGAKGGGGVGVGFPYLLDIMFGYNLKMPYLYFHLDLIS